MLTLCFAWFPSLPGDSLRGFTLQMKKVAEGTLKRIEMETLAGTVGVHDRIEDGIPISSISGAKFLKNVEMSNDKGKKISYLSNLPNFNITQKAKDYLKAMEKS